MTTLLTILIVVLLGVALMQLGKIFGLSQINKKDEEGKTPETATDKDNDINGKLMLMFGGFLYVVLIASFIMYWDFFLPDAASDHGDAYDSLFAITTVVIVIVYFITQAILHIFANKYKGKKGQKAFFYADNHKLELFWSVTPAIILSGLIIYGLYTWTEIMNIEDDPDVMVVEVYAKQFVWQTRYAGADNTLGDANVRFIEGVNTMGVDPSDPDGKDDVVTTELHLPVNKKVIFKFRSQDVLHSAYMPFHRAQMNVVPGMITEFAFTPTITSDDMRMTDEVREKVSKINKIRRENSKVLAQKGEQPLDAYEFEYYLLCNKICGSSHYNMQMKIVVETEEEFNNWMAEQAKLGEQLSTVASK